MDGNSGPLIFAGAAPVAEQPELPAKSLRRSQFQDIGRQNYIRLRSLLRDLYPYSGNALTDSWENNELPLFQQDRVENFLAQVEQALTDKANQCDFWIRATRILYVTD